MRVGDTIIFHYWDNTKWGVVEEIDPNITWVGSYGYDTTLMDDVVIVPRIGARLSLQYRGSDVVHHGRFRNVEVNYSGSYVYVIDKHPYRFSFSLGYKTYKVTIRTRWR